MTFLPTNTEYDGLHAGEASQLSGSFGAYDNIANVMNAGFEYQIYYDSGGTCDTTAYQNALYGAKIGSSITLSGCGFSSSTSAFTTSGSGTTQTVNVGGSQPNVVMNFDNGCCSYGVAYPNPPVLAAFQRYVCQ